MLDSYYDFKINRASSDFVDEIIPIRSSNEKEDDEPVTSGKEDLESERLEMMFCRFNLNWIDDDQRWFNKFSMEIYK